MLGTWMENHLAEHLDTQTVEPKDGHLVEMTGATSDKSLGRQTAAQKAQPMGYHLEPWLEAKMDLKMATRKVHHSAAQWGHWMAQKSVAERAVQLAVTKA